MPRPETTETLSIRYDLRCTPEQVEAWQAAAEADGRSLAGWVRRVLDGAAGDAKPRRRAAK